MTVRELRNTDNREHARPRSARPPADISPGTRVRLGAENVKQHNGQRVISPPDSIAPETTAPYRPSAPSVPADSSRAFAVISPPKPRRGPRHAAALDRLHASLEHLSTQLAPALQHPTRGLEQLTTQVRRLISGLSSDRRAPRVRRDARSTNPKRSRERKSS
jgi:hypothetical protein